MVPAASSAHVWPYPAVMALTPVRPGTVFGLREGVVVPSPNWPHVLAPQHATEPSERNAHVCLAPATTVGLNGLVAGTTLSVAATGDDGITAVSGATRPNTTSSAPARG